MAPYIFRILVVWTVKVTCNVYTNDRWHRVCLMTVLTGPGLPLRHRFHHCSVWFGKSSYIPTCNMTSRFDTPVVYHKNSDTQNCCCNNPKIWTVWFYKQILHPKDAYGMSNSVDPDLGLDSTLFAQTGRPRNLGSLRYNYSWICKVVDFCLHNHRYAMHDKKTLFWIIYAWTYLILIHIRKLIL